MVMKSIRSAMTLTAPIALILLFFSGNAEGQADNDRFNYDTTDLDNRDFGPRQWGNVRCDNLETCEGWPDDWLLGKEWGLSRNSCKWCADNRCERHHQSPINLERNRGVIGHSMENECIDVHWMKYEDGSCTWNDLERDNAFSIERHTLKITQPIEWTGGQDPYRLGCTGPGGRRFGRIDFSKGFSDWWFLSHIDFKVPSEHTQEGKRYDGEIQMAHFYSVTAEQAGVANEMAHVSMFLEAYDDAPPYAYLDRVICQWRKVEEQVRERCGLPAVDPYPGCFNSQRGRSETPSASPSNTSPSVSQPAVVVDLSPFAIPTVVNASETAAAASAAPQATISVAQEGGNGGGRRNLRTKSANDLLIEASRTKAKPSKRQLEMDPVNWREPDWTDDEWAEFIQAYSDHSNGKSTESQRKLLEGAHKSFHNYQPLIDVKTEYYYRYSGTQTVPPCYGPLTDNSRGNTNHWRVMKDPIRVNQRQITEMHRLIRERIAPPEDATHACQKDTAAKLVNAETGEISVARPLQSFSNTHFKTFCECKDWKSKWPEDQAWCNLDSDYFSKFTRFYDQPYNFQTGGQF